MDMHLPCLLVVNMVNEQYLMLLHAGNIEGYYYIIYLYILSTYI